MIRHIVCRRVKARDSAASHWVLGTERTAPRTISATLAMTGRLKPNVTIQQARDEMNRLYRQVELEHPNDGMPGRVARIDPLLSMFVSDVQRPLWIMFAAVGIHWAAGFALGRLRRRSSVGRPATAMAQ